MVLCAQKFRMSTKTISSYFLVSMVFGHNFNGKQYSKLCTFAVKIKSMFISSLSYYYVFIFLQMYAPVHIKFNFTHQLKVFALCEGTKRGIVNYLK